MAEEFCCERYKAQRLIEQLGLRESLLGDPMGAKRQYRDEKGADSWHAREYDGVVCFHRDKFNPEKHLIEHVCVDVVKPEAWVVGGLTTLAVRASGKDWKSALGWGFGALLVTQFIGQVFTDD